MAKETPAAKQLRIKLGMAQRYVKFHSLWPHILVHGIPNFHTRRSTTRRYLLPCRCWSGPLITHSLQKELAHYKADLVKQENKIRDMEAAGADPYDVKKQVCTAALPFSLVLIARILHH